MNLKFIFCACFISTAVAIQVGEHFVIMILMLGPKLINVNSRILIYLNLFTLSRLFQTSLFRVTQF